MMKVLLRRAAVLVLASAAGSGWATAVTYSGNLGDAANRALVASDLSTALFTDDLATANNVALYALTVPYGGSTSFVSTGFALGGADPYVTIFTGVNRVSASFLESNYLHAFSVGGDFTLAMTLAPGEYTVAIGVFANQSFAENLGSAFLADGFTGLGGPAYFGSGDYALTIALPDAAVVPEPSTGLLILTGVCLFACARRRQT
jgi:hypothetical protein